MNKKKFLTAILKISLVILAAIILSYIVFTWGQVEL